MKLPIAAALLVCTACADLPTSPVEPLRPNAPTAAQAQAETFTMVIPIQFSTWVCAENVSLSGELLMVQHLGWNDNGSHAKVLFLQKLTGTGQTSGNSYVAIGLSNGVSNTSGAGVFNQVSSFHLVSRGDKLLVTTRYHVTVNANGELSAQFLDFTVKCN